MSTKKSLNWKDLGQFVSKALDLFMFIRATLEPKGIGLEIIDWLNGDGRSVLYEHVQLIGEKFIVTRVNLSEPCRLPFPGAVIDMHRGRGLVKLEKKGDDLYFDGQKVGLFLFEEQKNGTICGYILRPKIESRGGNLSAKVLDYLEDHPELWPESWKKDENGNPVSVFFWEDIFRSGVAELRQCVRYGSWLDGRVVSYWAWLEVDWNNHCHAASVA